MSRSDRGIVYFCPRVLLLYSYAVIYGDKWVSARKARSVIDTFVQ